MRAIRPTTSILGLLALLLLGACYESHFPEAPVVPDPLVLVGVRPEAAEIVFERNDDGVVSEVVRIPRVATVASLEVSPDGRWAVVSGGTAGDLYLVSIPERRYEILDWEERGICTEGGRFIEWFGNEHFVIRCSAGRERARYLGTLDRIVRRFPVAPGCRIGREAGWATFSPRHQVLLARCPDGDYLVGPNGEVTVSLGILPRTTSLNIVGPNRLGGYTSEFRGSRYRTWDIDGESTGALVPLVAVGGGSVFPSPHTAWHGEVASTSTSGGRLYFNPQSGEERLLAQCANGEQPVADYPPNRRHLLLKCDDELRYIDTESGSEQRLATTETSYVQSFSRDGTRILVVELEPTRSFSMYDLIAEEWSEPWPDPRVNQRWLLGHPRF